MSQAQNQKNREFFWLVGRRLRQVREDFGFIRQADFGLFLDRFPATTLSRSERGDNLPGPRLLLALVERCAVNLNWLFTGKGDMLVSDVPRIAHLAGAPGVIRHDPDYDRRIKARSAELAAAKRNDPIKPPSAQAKPEFLVKAVFEKGYEEIDREDLGDLADLAPSARPDLVPIVGRIAAGAGIDTGEAGQFATGDAASYIIYAGPKALPPRAFAVKVDGRSMSPDFEPRDLVIADTGHEVEAGRPAVVVYRDETGEGVAALKDLSLKGRDFILASRAKGYKPLILPAKRLLHAYAVFAVVKYLKRKGGVS